VVLIKATILTESELIAALKWVGGPSKDVWAWGAGPRCNPFGLQGTHLSTSLLVLGGVGALRPNVPTPSHPKETSVPLTRPDPLSDGCRL